MAEMELNTVTGELIVDGQKVTLNARINDSATTAPTTSNDDSEGYGVGSTWIDTTNDKAYICTDPTTSAAVWVDVTSSGGGVEVNDLSSVVTWAIVPDAFISQSSVTQHEGAIDHDALLNFIANEHIDWTVDNVTNDIHQNNISEVSVTQHEGALTITESQISDLDKTDADAIHDNVAGEIAAITEKTTPVSADLIVIEDSADANNKKRVQVGNLPGGGGGSSVSFPAIWKFDTSTSSGDPGSGEFRMNNATPASVTELYINDATENGADYSVILNALSSGDIIAISQEEDGTRYIVATVSSVTDNTGWFTLGVTINDSGTLFESGKECIYSLNFIAGGGGSSTLAGLTDTDITSPTADQILAYNNTSGQWENTTPGTIPLEDVADVDTAGKADNDALKYNSSTGNWEAKPETFVFGPAAHVGSGAFNGSGFGPAYAINYAMPNQTNDNMNGANSYYFIPWVCEKSGTISEATIRIQSAGTNVLCGLYDTRDPGGISGDIAPGLLLEDVGTFNAGSTGAKTISGLTVSVSAGRMYYWCLKVLGGTGPSFQCVPATAHLPGVLGMSAGGASIQTTDMFTAASTDTSLAADASTLALVDSSTVPVAWFWVRYTA